MVDGGSGNCSHVHYRDCPVAKSPGGLCAVVERCNTHRQVVLRAPHAAASRGAASACAASSLPSSSASRGLSSSRTCRCSSSYHHSFFSAAFSGGAGSAGAPYIKELSITRRTPTPRRCLREKFIAPHTAVMSIGQVIHGGSQRRRRQMSRTSSGRVVCMRFGCFSAHEFAEL